MKNNTLMGQLVLAGPHLVPELLDRLLAFDLRGQVELAGGKVGDDLLEELAAFGIRDRVRVERAGAVLLNVEKHGSQIDSSGALGSEAVGEGGVEDPSELLGVDD